VAAVALRARGAALSAQAWLEPVVELARRAGAAVMEVYAGDFGVRCKADTSPLTEADEIAEALIVPALLALAPGVPVVSEEAFARGEGAAVTADRFWLVDPLDGTREFVARNGEFTVNIALVEQGVPVLGVVFAPAFERLYAAAPGAAPFVEAQGVRRSIHCRIPPREGAVVLASRSHDDPRAIEALLQGLPVAATQRSGSSLKFGLLAQGLGDLYPRLGPTMEWDTAAGEAVLRAAGGGVVDLLGRPLRYGKPGFGQPSFVAFGARPWVPRQESR
jgi:3'(2'), 5'-bisphosphate nucleotidase